MYKQNSSQVYPPVIQKCPDYYKLDTRTGTCTAESLWGFNAGQIYTSTRTGLNCVAVDFSGNNVGGMGSKSTLCSKKRWAEDCGVTWDGITNNQMICYTQYA